MNILANYLSELVLAQLEQRKPLPIPEEVDAEQIGKISIENHMCYLLMGALLKTDNLSEQYKEPFSAYVLHSVQRTLMQVTELKQILKICEEQGIRNQPMKGACMKFIYPSPEMREMSDIDILIDKTKMKEIGKALEERGYKLIDSERQHDVYGKDPFMVVEAHHTLYDKTVDQKQFRYFTSFSKTQLREGCRYTYDYKIEDFYVYMMAHMAKHFYARGCGIRNIIDVYIYLKEYKEKMNWDYTEKELRVCGLWEFTVHMQKMAEIWLEHKPSSEFYDNLFEYMMNSGIYGKDENGIWNRFAEKGKRKKDVSPKQLKMWYLFPPLSYMAELYPVLEEHSYLLPIYWIVRGFHGALKKTGENKMKMLQDIEQDEIKTYREIYSKMGLHFRR